MRTSMSRSGQNPFQVGIYLGSFNPIHHGHLQLARTARDQHQLDAVEIVALGTPSHKPGMFMSDEDRQRMNELAVQGEPRLVASSLDIDARQYPDVQAKVKWMLQRTLNLLDAVRHKYERLTGRPVALRYIVGADGIAGYPQAWREPEYRAFLEKCQLLIAPRPGAPPIWETIRKMKALGLPVRWKPLKMTLNDLSSTAIRDLMEKGLPVPERMTPSAVAQYLNAHAARLVPRRSA